MRHVGVAFAVTFGLLLAAARADSQTVGSCITRTVAGAFSGSGWLAQEVCHPGELAVSGNGFCGSPSQPPGQMIGSSTTSGTTDQRVWLWCTGNTPAIWYGVCCQQQTPPPPKSLTNCVTRTVSGAFSGTAWLGKQVCQPNEVAVSGNGFCGQLGQPGRPMVGASTTANGLDGWTWLWCAQDGPAIWYGMCCQTR